MNEVLEMTKRNNVTFGEQDLKPLEEIETKLPEWKFLSQSQKIKTIYRKGIRAFYDQLNIYKLLKTDSNTNF